MKFEFLTNDLQKKLFSKVYDLLMDTPRRLTKEDASVALCEAWRQAFRTSLSAHTMINQKEWKDLNKVLAVGKTPEEALYNFFQHDAWASQEFHSILKVHETHRKIKHSDGMITWMLNYEIGGDRFVAAGLTVAGGATLLEWNTKSTNAENQIIPLLLHWAIEKGWNKSCLIDILSQTPQVDGSILVSFEVRHGKVSQYTAKLEKKEGWLFLNEVQEK